MKNIRKITEKGQITLPVAWRKNNRVELVTFIDKGAVLEIHPADIITDEEVLFDAVLDNNGTGIPAGELIKALKRELS